jgi:hypothetical protein
LTKNKISYLLALKFSRIGNHPQEGEFSDETGRI